MQNENATNGLKTSDFYFDLPEELIAQDPLLDRSGSRLLVLDKETGKTKHKKKKSAASRPANSPPSPSTPLR